MQQHIVTALLAVLCVSSTCEAMEQAKNPKQQDCLERAVEWTHHNVVHPVWLSWNYGSLLRKLDKAARRDNPAEITTIIGYGINPNAYCWDCPDRFIATCLHYKSWQALKALLEKGATPEAADVEAAFNQQECPDELKHALLSKRLAVPYGHLIGIFRAVIAHGSVTQLQEVMAAGASVKDSYTIDDSPLAYAALVRPAMVPLLIDQGAPVTADVVANCIVGSDSAILTTVLRNYAPVQEKMNADLTLDDAISSVLKESSQGEHASPFFEGLKKASAAMIADLHMRGFDITQQVHGKTLLWFATDRAALQELVLRGVDLEACDEDGKTIVHHLAQTNGATELAALFTCPKIAAGDKLLANEPHIRAKVALHMVFLQRLCALEDNEGKKAWECTENPNMIQLLRADDKETFTYHWRGLIEREYQHLAATGSLFKPVA